VATEGFKTALLKEEKPRGGMFGVVQGLFSELVGSGSHKVSIPKDVFLAVRKEYVKWWRSHQVSHTHNAEIIYSVVR